MAKVSVDVPERMKDRLEELAEENLYRNTSEYIRDALRERIEKDEGLTEEEKREVAERMERFEEGETSTISMEEAKKRLGINE